MTIQNRHFRTAYVASNTGHNFDPLLEFCDEIKFVTTGYEKEEVLEKEIRKSLENFEPSLDILVPVGSVYTNMLIGMVIRHWWVFGSISIAFFQDQQYHICDVFEPKDEDILQ
jgi:hypothetical protein